MPIFKSREAQAARPHFGRDVSLMVGFLAILTACTPQIVSSQDIPNDRGQMYLDCSIALASEDERSLENLQPQDTFMFQPGKNGLGQELGVQLIYKGNGAIDFKFIDYLIKFNAKVERINANSFRITKGASEDKVFTTTLQTGDKSTSLKIEGACVK